MLIVWNAIVLNLKLGIFLFEWSIASKYLATTFHLKVQGQQIYPREKWSWPSKLQYCLYFILVLLLFATVAIWSSFFLVQNPLPDNIDIYIPVARHIYIYNFLKKWMNG